MPPKGSTSKRARKSTAGGSSKPLSKPASKPSKPASRSVQVAVGSSDDENAAPARRSKREQTSEDEDEQEEEENDELKSNPSDSDDIAEELTSASAKKRKTNSTSTAARKTKSTTASPPKKSTSGRQSLKGPSSSSKAIKTGSKPSSRAAPVAAPSKKKASTKKSSTTAKAGSKRKRTTTSISDNDASDDESVPTTRSRSSRGYTWEAEVINIDPEKVLQKLVYHSSIKTDIDADYDHLPGEEKVKFRRDQVIYILPDPHTLPGRSDEIGPEELPDDEFWCARIVDCCALDQGPGESPLGLLRIAWFYSPDQAMRLDTLQHWTKKLKEHRWAENEMLASDHLDFVGVDAFCGFPEGRIEYSTMIQGLIVDDVERMKKPAMRTASNRTKRIVGLPFDGDKDGSNAEKYLAVLSKETKEEQEKRKIKDKKRKLKEDAIRRRTSGRKHASDDEDEATDAE